MGLAFLSSYDVWIFTPILMAAMAMHRYGRSRKTARILCVGAGGALLAIIAKLVTNAWALGGVAKMTADVRYQLSERATSNVVRTSFGSGMLPTLYGRIDREFTLLFIAVIVFWTAWPWLRRPRDLGPDIVNPVVLLLAAVPFLLVFRELWVAQYYPLLLLVPFWAIGTGIMLEWCFRSSNRVARYGGIVAGLAMVVSLVSESVAFPRAFFEDTEIASLQRQIPRFVPPGQRILTNLIVDAPYRYYVDRDVVPVMVHEAYRMPMVLDHFADPSHPEFSGPDGAVLVLHRDVQDALFDKGYYYILAPYRLWNAWGEPQRYRQQIDSIVIVRDKTLLHIAQAVGEKLYESPDFSMWRIPPSSRWKIPAPGGSIPR
jgi:hypothetical protein